MFKFHVEGGDHNKDGKVDVYIHVEVAGFTIFDDTKNVDTLVANAIKGVLVSVVGPIMKLVKG